MRSSDMAGTILDYISYMLCVTLFLFSLLTVVAWAVQHSLGKRDIRKMAWPLSVSSKPKIFPPAVWDSLSNLGFRWYERNADTGVKGLLSSLLSFEPMKENCRQAWVQALNEQAYRHGSSIQIYFGENLQFPASASIDRITYADRSAHSMVLHCNCTVDTVTFPVTVTQQSPAAVSVETYKITIAPLQAQMVVCLEDMDKDGLLASWTFSQEPRLCLTVLPCRVQREVDEGVDVYTVGELVKNTIISTEAALILRLRSSDPEPKYQEEDNDHGHPNPSLPILTRMADSATLPGSTVKEMIPARLQEDCRLEAPCHSSLKTELVEKQHAGNAAGHPEENSPHRSLDSEVSHGQDSEDGSAVRQLIASSDKAVKGTPPKKVTMKALTDEDGPASLAGGAAAMNMGQEAGAEREVPQSDNGERVSANSTGWEMGGSTGALEIHSLKEQKGGFLRSSTRLLLRKRSRQKDPSLSRSHEDVADSSSGCSPRRRSSSFSRRLIKRLSLRSRSGGKSSPSGGTG